MEEKMEEKTSFDLEAGPEREKALAFIKDQGVPQDEAIELLDTSIGIARKVLSTPRFSSTRQYFKDLLPRLILSRLGEEYTREERFIIEQNFPTGRPLKSASFEDPETRELMTRFSYSMKYVIEEMVGYHLQQKKED